VKSLKEFLKSGVSDFPYLRTINSTITLRIYSSQPDKERIFQFAGGSDGDAGGSLYYMIIENIRHCIKEKSDKVSNNNLYSV
jgi:hypothetical protein